MAAESLTEKQDLLLQQMKDFDESKAGVKGLVDAGVTQIPEMFHHPPIDHGQQSLQTKLTAPVVDLTDSAFGMRRHAEVVDQIRRASETVGLFQVVNHEIPKRVREEMLEAMRGFHELPKEVKGEYYSSDRKRKVRFVGINKLAKSSSRNYWRDSFICDMTSDEPFDPMELPDLCRDITMEYSEHVEKLGVTLFELLAEGLGLKPDHFLGLECAKSHYILGSYYPPCPQPELTIGVNKHTDRSFLTLLLQNHVTGLQAQYENQWIHADPIPGAIVVGIGDMLQLITNDIYKSGIHRVLSMKEGPRVSVGCFFQRPLDSADRIYEPIKELISEDNPPVYHGTTLADYLQVHFVKGTINGVSGLEYLKV